MAGVGSGCILCLAFMQEARLEAEMLRTTVGHLSSDQSKCCFEQENDTNSPMLKERMSTVCRTKVLECDVFLVQKHRLRGLGRSR